MFLRPLDPAGDAVAEHGGNGPLEVVKKKRGANGQSTLLTCIIT